MLDEQKMREIRAVAPGLEISDSSWPTYERLVILRALEFFQELQEAGGLERFIRAAEAGRPEAEWEEPTRSRGSSPAETYCNSDFLLAVSGKDSAEAWAVMDGLMSSLRDSNARVYERTMKKIRDL